MNRYIIIIFLVVGTCLLCSCNKQLSEPPANARVEGTAIIDQKSANTALNGVYYRFANVTGDNVAYWRTHQICGAFLSGMMGYGFGALEEEKNDNINATFTPGIWTESYTMINAANGVIEGVNTVKNDAFTDNRKSEILAESRFLRAYGHFKLLTYFAEWDRMSSANGVLLRDKFSALSTIPQKRSTVAESYDFIVDDLNYAIANAPSSNQPYYATRWAAMVLKMRLLITRGNPADYAELINLADNILQNGPYVLEDNLKDIFYTKGLSSKEVILGVKPQPNQETYFSNMSRSYYPATSALFIATKTFKDLLANDPRGTWMVGPLTPYQAYAPNTYYFTKYIPYRGTCSQLTETSYAMRLSEVYLLKAEAIIRSGGDLTTVKGLIKTVMSKAGVTDFSAVERAVTADELLEQNYYEILRNLTGEDGLEWLALMRLPFDKVKQLRPTITTDKQFYLPVPRTEFDRNPLFGQQNTGYGQ